MKEPTPTLAAALARSRSASRARDAAIGRAKLAEFRLALAQQEIAELRWHLANLSSPEARRRN